MDTKPLHTPRKRLDLFFRWLLVLLWMGLIFSFSAQTAEESSQSSGSAMYFLLRLFRVDRMDEILADSVLYSMADFILRKCAHFIVFAVLGLLLCHTVHGYGGLSPANRFCIPSVLGILYALTDEFHQLLVPGRACQFRDMCIDAAGVVSGVLVCLLLYHWIAVRRARKQGKSAN